MQPFVPAWEPNACGEHYLTAGPFTLCIFITSLVPREGGPEAVAWRWELIGDGGVLAHGCDDGVSDLERVKAEAIGHAQQLARAVFDAVGWV